MPPGSGLPPLSRTSSSTAEDRHGSAISLLGCCCCCSFASPPVSVCVCVLGHLFFFVSVFIVPLAGEEPLNQLNVFLYLVFSSPRPSGRWARTSLARRCEGRTSVGKEERRARGWPPPAPRTIQPPQGPSPIPTPSAHTPGARAQCHTTTGGDAGLLREVFLISFFNVVVADRLASS